CARQSATGWADYIRYW
nr:immunoglobulin heavy chain junction region [Macaca mulatta]MOW98691.1 immunoglobulin heavy chain junction region [Macaca mulatta]MOX00784.1 immunoglobulin heavy chain junction region [Macaca mulatta]MOX01384.1 immunoglobulin heavy chain junction region [Macaca mulatta]MOX01523.1 immunoglobulin heavy chain junction region [Macaca mulatta]